MAYPKKQMSLVIMDMFKRQDNNDLREPCIKNNCEIIIITRSLTNKVQRLDLSVKKAAKTYISNKRHSTS